MGELSRDEVRAETAYRAARQLGWFVANFMVAESVCFWWVLGTWWSKGATQTEVAQGALVLAIGFVPPAFILLYLAFRLATKTLYRRYAEFHALVGPWL